MSNPWDEIICFIVGVYDDLFEEYRSTMLHENINISRLIVHAHQVEETQVKWKNTEFIRGKCYEGGTSKGRLDIQDKPMIKNRVCNKCPSNIPKVRNGRVSNPRSQKVSGNSPIKKSTCSMCGKNHWSECLIRTENCFGCGKSSHKIWD